MDNIFKSEIYDYSLLQNKIDSLCKRYTFLRKMSIGKSSFGNNITAIKLGNQNEIVLFTAAFHGSEHITTNVLMLWFEAFCDSLTTGKSFCGINLRKAFYGKSLVTIPRINPDGCDISIHGKSACRDKYTEIFRMCDGDFTHFNANARGVDINHNFNADWETLKQIERKQGILSPSKTRFGGFFPESEPETVSLCKFCRENHIRHAIALHSQGEVIYWSYNDIKPKKAKLMAEIMASSSGYALDFATGIAKGGGFKDWFIKEFNRPAFTIELGKGENPLPIETADNIYENCKEMFTLSTIM